MDDEEIDAYYAAIDAIMETPHEDMDAYFARIAHDCNR